MKDKLLPHLIGPLVTFGLTVLIEVLSRAAWYTPTLALPFIGLAVSAIYGGLRSSLASATIIVLYGIVEFNFEPGRNIQVALAAYSVAIVNGVGKRALRKWILEVETNRRKAELVDNLNGNLKAMLNALSTLDKLRAGWDDYTETRRFEMTERAIGILSNLLTMVRSWQEIAETKEKAIDYLNEMGGYPYRVDDAVKEILANQQQTLKLINYLGQLIEQEKNDPKKPQLKGE